MLSPQSQLLERNLALFDEGSWLIINPADAYFSDLIPATDATFMYQYADMFIESVKVIPSCEFDSRDVSTRNYGFNVTQKIGRHQHYFAPFVDSNSQYTDVLIYLPKSKAHMQMLIAMAHSALTSGGRIHIVGENKGGIKSVSKLLANIGAHQKVDSARHCSLITAIPSSAATDFTPAHWLNTHTYHVAGVDWDVVSMPGVFSHGELDEGTQMLLEKGSDKLRGDVLDFACGAGVIGAYLLKQFPHVTMTMLDVSALAIFCSARTLSSNGQAATLIAANGLHGVEQRFNHIATNPPFHTGVKTDYTVTRRFIEDSKQHLKPGGSLQLVANRFLPYPGLLGDVFPQTHTVAQDNKYSLYRSICN